ncbi:hypothetical protein [uncultured Selenomonas sp.]|uniref:hypothetical protein n=1 Tax=uncultured Selenomonas sp. TaxID=159275 RepID=UPI002803777E|nr:hypothetical protein [uncultured Selenomonas sp.]
MSAADGPSAVVSDGDCRAVAVHPQGFALIRTLAEPSVVPVGEPGRKFWHTAQLDEIVPAAAGSIPLHLAL